MKLLEIDPKTGKYKLSHRVLIPKPEGYVERERRPRPERGERGERRERGERGNRNERRERQPRNNDRRFEDRDPMQEREPHDFSDALDHSLDID